MSDYSKICIPKMLVEFNGCKGTQLNNIALYNGTIFINGRAIDTAYENDAYYWHRRTRCYDGEKGILKLSNNGLLGQGIIEYNNVKYSFITFGENQYLMSYINPEGLEKSFEFNMGIRKDDNGNLFTYGKVITGDSEMDELINSFNPVTFQVLNNKLHANININSVICSYGILEFIDAQFDFNLTYEDAIGKITMYDNTKSDYLGLQCDLSGQCIHPNLSTIKEKHTLFMSVKGRSLNKGLLKEKLPNLLPLKKDLSLSVNELYSLEAPNGYEIQERAMTTLFNLMLYSIDDTLRGYFGQAKPIIGIDLTQADVDLLKDDEIKIFLTNFAKAYLCKAYTGSGDEKVKTAIYKAANLDSKMKYFWEGNGKTSLASNDGYNLAASDIFQRTYGILTPGLVKYYDNNPKEWAEKLYNYCTTDTVLASIAIQELSDGTSRINHLSSILHFLYPDSLVKLEITNETVPYSVALFYKVLDYKLNNAITENSTNNIDNYDEFQKEFFSQYISQIFDEDGTLFDDREKKEAVEDINKYMELNKISTREELILEMSALASQFALFALKVIKPTTQSINEFFQINTTSSMYVRLGIGMFVYITGIGACVQCLIDWEN